MQTTGIILLLAAGVIVLFGGGSPGYDPTPSHVVLVHDTLLLGALRP